MKTEDNNRPKSFVIKTSVYAGVSLENSRYGNKSNMEARNKKPWRASFTKNGNKWSKYFPTEREAAIAYDLKMIEFGYPPVNILKKSI